MISTTRLFVVAAIAVFASMSVGCSAHESDRATEGTSEGELSRARFTSLRNGPTDADLKAFYRAGAKYEHGYLGAYRFNKAGPEARDPEAREKRIKEVMHRYMCRFFDESIDIGRNSGARPVDSVMNELNIADQSWENGDDEAGLRSALGRVYDNDKLDVLSGGASGNNTVGEVMGVYDIEHHEVVFFGFTNCGSDS